MSDRTKRLGVDHLPKNQQVQALLKLHKELEQKHREQKQKARGK